MVSIDITFLDFVKRVQEKFNSNGPLKLKYKDEDSTMVSMTDQEDLEMAISMIRDTGKMEVSNNQP